MNRKLACLAVGGVMALLGGCAHNGPVVDVQTAPVSAVLNELKEQLTVFAADAASSKLSAESNCGAGFRVVPVAATVTLSAVGARQADTSVGLGIPLLDLSAKGSSVNKNSTKIVLPLTIVQAPAAKALTRSKNDMDLAAALIDLRDELLKVNHNTYPCFKADKGIKLSLTFEAVRSGTGGFTLAVAPVKAGATFSTSATTLQSIEVDLGILDNSGNPVPFGKPGGALK